MRAFVQSVSAAAAAADDLLREGQADTYEMSDRDRADLQAALFASMRTSDVLVLLIDQSRKCPGPYWRDDEDVRAKMDTFVAAQTRKRKRLESACMASTKHQPRFTHECQGPTGSQRTICDACGLQLVKDRKAGFLNKQ